MQQRAYFHQVEYFHEVECTVVKKLGSGQCLSSSKNTNLPCPEKWRTDFKKTILSFIIPKANSVFNFNSSKGLKFVARLRLRWSYVREHKFKNSFQDSINSLRSCSLDFESTIYYFLHCPLFTIEIYVLPNTISPTANKLLDSNESNLIQHLLFGNLSRHTKTNTEILNATTKRFDERRF